MRYRRALHELEAAEREFEAHVALKRGRQVALARKRDGAEAARCEHARAIKAEVERLERTRALQALVEERLARRQHSSRPRAAFGRAPPPVHDLVRTHVDLGATEDFVPHHRFPGCRRSRSHLTHRPSPRDNEDEDVFSIRDLLKLIVGVHLEPEPPSPTQELTSPTAEPKPKPEPQPQSQPRPGTPRHDDGEVTFSNILGFFHDYIASQARDAAAGYQSTHEPNAPSHPEATPADDKGKGKAKSERVSEPTLFQALFGERMNGALDQEMGDIQQAIKLSLQGRDATDAKKAQASKTSRSSPGATSSKVKIEEPSHSSRAAFPARSSASTATPTSVPQPPSPLTTIRAVRSRFSALESAFKFPLVLDFDHSELAVTPNNPLVRAYEQALNGLLEQLDAVESDGDEEVRDARRDVVREVERALEDVEQQVKKRAPQEAPVPEVAKEEVNGYDIGSEEREVDAIDVEDVKLTPPDLVPTTSPTDADVDLAIYEEYSSASPVVGSSEVVGSAPSPPSPPAEGGHSTLDAAFGNDAMADSIATITSASPAASVPNNAPAHLSPGPETFLTSLSHEHFTFPRNPASGSQPSVRVSGEVRDDDGVLVDDSSEGGSAKGADDGWSEVDA